MKMKKLTTEELIIFERLLTENRDSAKLQIISECDYIKSISLIQKVRKLWEREDEIKRQQKERGWGK